MLSNPPPSGLHARHRQHKRQNSTPTAFETMKIVKNLPKSLHQQQQQSPQRPTNRQRMSHRRGMSLDVRQLQPLQPMPSPTTTTTTTTQGQESHTVSNTNNTNDKTGFTRSSQHVLREAQQQRMARPGPQQAYANLASDENYLVSPHDTMTQLEQTFEGQCFEGLQSPQNVPFPYSMCTGPLNAVIKKNQESFSNNMTVSQDFELFPSSTLSTPTFVNFPDNPLSATGWTSEGETSSTRRSSRRISNGIVDRVSKFENMGLEVQQRPLTPTRQNAPAQEYFPLTPMDTPHDRTVKHSQRLQRFEDGYDESAEETIKPTRNRRVKTTFDEMREAAETPPMMPTPHRANTLPMPEAFEGPEVTPAAFLNYDQATGAGLQIDTIFDGLPGSSHPLSATSNYSGQTTPITPSFEYFNRDFEYTPDLVTSSHGGVDMPSSEPSPCAEKFSRRNSPHHHHRRNESIASIASAASIASIDIERAKTETGITTDDIRQYIEGPDPRDNKWTCKFEDCDKKFGRKENIKSHVQTHLNDRQYKCPTCKKCFVRQHDLKRHAKIHTGIKPYPCECGNSFARHDALTRHRQRGMCIGAFDGIVRKVVKRGRPRKHRPDMDDRKEKSTKTRKKNKSTSSVSSQSGYSDSSAVNSPDNAGNDPDNDDDLNMLDDIMDVSMGGTTMNPSGLQGLAGASSAPMPTLGSPDPTLSAHSPSHDSVHSYVSQLSQMSLHPETTANDELSPHSHSHPASPTKSVTSHVNEPPELDQSSSPSPGNHFVDSEDPTGSSAADMLLSSAAETSGIPSLVGLGEDDDLLLQFTNSDQTMLMLSGDAKFDEAFDGVDMFSTSTDDLFFG